MTQSTLRKRHSLYVQMPGGLPRDPAGAETTGSEATGGETSPFLRSTTKSATHSRPRSLKLLLIGDPSVGKTAAILSFCGELPTRRQLQQRRDASLAAAHSPSVQSPPPSPSLRMVERVDSGTSGRNPPLTPHAAERRKRYSLGDFEELARRRSLLRRRAGNTESSPGKGLGLGLGLGLSPTPESGGAEHTTHNDTLPYPGSYSPAYSPGGYSPAYSPGGYSPGYPAHGLGGYTGLPPPEELVIQTHSTIGVDIKTRLVQLPGGPGSGDPSPGGTVECTLWDTAGQERFENALVPSLYHRCDGVLLAYDITSAASFQHCLDRWLPQAQAHLAAGTGSGSGRGHPARLYLLGCKLDLQARRAVSHEDVLRGIARAERRLGVHIRGNFEVSSLWPQSVAAAVGHVVVDLCGARTLSGDVSEDMSMSEDTSLSGDNSPDMSLSQDTDTPAICLARPLPPSAAGSPGSCCA